MKGEPRLFNLDTVMVDVVMMIDELPVRGGDALTSQRLVTTGGGFNVMSAAARHGMSVVYAGQLGTGSFAAVARDALHREQIATPVAPDPSSDTGFCVVLVERDGERTFVTAPGAEKHLDYQSLVSLDVRSGDYVFLSGYCLVYAEIGASVEEWLPTLADDVIVAFDPAPRVLDIPSSIMRTVLARTDWLLCNAREAQQMSGSSSSEEAMTWLLAESGRAGVVIHDGSGGCLVSTRNITTTRVMGFATSVLDTNGAGDTHDGVFLAELARGTEVLEAARRANAAAALAIRLFGPATCPTNDEVSKWLE